MLVLCFLFTKHKNQAHCLRKSIIQNAVIFPSWTSKMYLFTDPFWMIQGNVLITITTVCFPSSIEIYDNRLILLVTFIWFFFKKVSFDLKSTNFEKAKEVACFFPFYSNFFANIYTSSFILKSKLASMELTRTLATQ